MLRKIKVGFDSHILWNGIASVWKKTGTIQNLPKAHQTQDIECLDLINIEALTSYEVLVILVLFGKGKYTKDFWQIHITTLTNPFQNFDKSMSKSRQIQVTTLTNLALTTWIFFFFRHQKHVLLWHHYTSMKYSAATRSSSHSGVTAVKFQKHQWPSDQGKEMLGLESDKKNVRHTFVVFFSV